MRWPFQPLHDFLGMSTTSFTMKDTWKTMAYEQPMVYPLVGELCGVSVRSVARWKRDGLSDVRADEVAARLGVHPSAIWPDWFEAVA